MVCFYMLDVLCVGVPKTTLRFSNSLGDLLGLGMWSCSQLCFISAKGYQAQSAKEKVLGTKSRGNQSKPPESPLSAGKPYALYSPSNKL